MSSKKISFNDKEGEDRAPNFHLELQNLERSFLSQLDDLRRRQEEYQTREKQNHVSSKPPEEEDGSLEEFIVSPESPQPKRSDRFDFAQLKQQESMKRRDSGEGGGSKKGGFRRSMSLFFKNFGHDEDTDSPVHNTGGIHMLFALLVTERVSTFRGRLGRWMVAFASMSIVVVQILVLYWVTFEASSPTCTTHEDCGVGEFCEDALADNAFFRVPRCTDCAKVPYEEEWISNCTKYDRLSRDSLYWVSADSTWHPDSLYEDPYAIPCLKIAHCRETSIEAVGVTYPQENLFEGRNYYPEETEEFVFEHLGNENSCDFITLSMAKFGITHQTVFGFVTLLFAATLVADIFECMLEEEILNHGRDRSETAFSPVEIIRLSLRIRRFTIPWLVARTATSIIIVDPLSAKNILLNLLAIGTIVETDNLLGAFFVTSRQTRYIDKLVESAQKDPDLRPSFLLSRILGSLPALMVVYVVLQLEPLLEAFGSSLVNNGNCSDIAQLFNQFFIILSPFLVIITHAIGVLFDAKDHGHESNDLGSNVSIRRRCFNAALELSRNMNAVGVTITVETLGSIGMVKFSQERNEFFFGLSTLLLNMIIFSQLDSRKNKRVQLVMTIVFAIYFIFMLGSVYLLQQEGSAFNEFMRPREVA